MLTYKFIVTHRGRLGIRLRNNNKKTELALPRLISRDELEEVLSGQPKKSESAERRNLRLLVSQYSAYFERLSAQILADGNMKIDVMEVRADFEKHFGLVEETEKKNVGTFVAHFQKFIDGKENKGTRDTYKHTLCRIHVFDPNVDEKSFEDINLQWLTDFEAFCAKTACKNARNIHLRNIRAVFNNAIDFEITAAYPFRRFKIRPEATRKRSLSVDELRRLFVYPVEPYAEIYRDMFKLIFCLIGINTVDLHGLKSITRDGRIEYKRAKTHRDYSIKVEPEALEIIEKYKGVKGLLCIADRWSDHRNFGNQCNKALHKIGSMERKGRGGKKFITAEFEGVTTYFARHSWATIAYNDLQIPKDIIAQALGHSGGETVTDIYLDKDPRLVDEANRRVLDWVLYGKR